MIRKRREMREREEEGREGGVGGHHNRLLEAGNEICILLMLQQASHTLIYSAYLIKYMYNYAIQAPRAPAAVISHCACAARIGTIFVKRILYYLP